jgi:glycosyltransferase involved in cell wall biosynthesis
MRIAFITPDDRDSFRHYADPRPYFSTGAMGLLDGLALLPECEVHVVCCVRQPVAVPKKIGPNIFYHADIVPKWGWIRSAYLGCIHSIRQQLRRIQPDIVHGQGTESYAGICAVFSGFPNVLTIQGNMRLIAKLNNERMFSYNWLMARLEAFTLPRTDGVVCISHYTRRAVEKLARRTWVVPHAVRLPFLDQRPAAGPPADARPILLNVGVVSARKRQLEMLGLARNLWRRGFRFELRFIGTVQPHTPYDAEFLRQITQAQADGYARYLGWLETKELIAALDDAAGIVHFPAEEAFGMVVSEALARNLKFFGAAVGGINDIASGVEGVELFPADGWAALENGIARWLESGSPRPASAAKTMSQRYHPEAIARRHLEIYREVLANHRR